MGQSVYLNMIARAKKYIYITTPYLIVDVATNTALCNAAKSGVDVYLITPHIPDKRYVFEVTHAHYPPLLDAGVHKMCIRDRPYTGPPCCGWRRSGGSDW